MFLHYVDFFTSVLSHIKHVPVKLGLLINVGLDSVFRIGGNNADRECFTGDCGKD